MAQEEIIQREKTLAELKALVYFLTGEDEDVFAEDKVTFALNAGLALVYRNVHREPKPVYFDTYNGEYIYEIPEVSQMSGNAIIDDVLIDDESLTAILVENMDTDVANTDTPTDYAVEGNRLYLSPIPDDTYTVKAIIRPEFFPLVEDTDSVNMTDIETNAAAFYACYLLKIQDEELQSAQYFRGLFDENLGIASQIPTGVYSAIQGVTYGGAN